MCGLSGFIDKSGKLTDSTLRRMQSSLQHRGPDDNGLWIVNDGETRVGLAHTRLAIMDLSNAGQQPMRFGPLSIVFNGEIYNFREIRDDLIAVGHAFITDCDTEVILHAFAEWGTACLDRFVGMFAFALHDSTARRIYFVRDRAGVKPLYVYLGRNMWLFGSELKALVACAEFPARVSTGAIRAFFRHGHVPDDRCIYEDCHKVDAGTYWVVDTQSLQYRVVRWWDQTALYGRKGTRASFEEATDELEDLLYSACNYRMVSDVPVGVFLSGGYDSTAVASILQCRSSQPIKTFTIGFTEGNDEAPAARKIAQALGTEHYELYCSPMEALEIVPKLPEIYDEPLADSSGIPTTLVSRMAREHVKVALSADGGDELFGGYNSYPQTWRRLKTLYRIPPQMRDSLAAPLRTAIRTTTRNASALRHKTEALANSLSSNNALMAQRLHGAARLMPRSLIDALIPHTAPDDADFIDRDWPRGTHPIDACMGLDYQTYLKDDILTKVDRATMYNSLEGREPLLDHRLAEFAARLPISYKYDGTIRKRILKAVVHRRVPQTLMQRPKSGFSLPLMKWLANELKPEFDKVCSDRALRESEFFETDTARSWIAAFRAGRFHYTPLIWRLFVFQSWHDRWRR